MPCERFILKRELCAFLQTADVYPFGIILWEIVTRLEPYEDKEPMQIVVEVVNHNLRPTIPDEFSTSPIVSLMKDCWSPEPAHRHIQLDEKNAPKLQEFFLLT